MPTVERPHFAKHHDDEEFLASLRARAEVLAPTQAAATEKEFAKPRRKRAEGRFVIAGLSGLIAAAAAVDDRSLLVWLFLVYQARLHNVSSVKMTNQALTEWGVDRFTKYRALEKLEAAGLIAVERRHRSSPTVTLKHEL